MGQLAGKKIIIVGAGIMGAGIAQTCAEAGFEIMLTDTCLELAQKGLGRIGHFLQRKVEKGKLEQVEMAEVLKRIHVIGSIDEGANADIVIEVVSEDVQIKQEVFRKLEKVCKFATLIASNTSTISITLLGSFTSRPEKVVGMHFFIPAPVMKLVEVIPGLCTSTETVENAMALARELGKTPVKSPDTPAFIVNRLLVPMWNEAMFLVQEGCNPKDIDEAMKLGANLPMGPLELADFAGLDTVLAVMIEMFEKFGDPKYRPCPLLRRMVYGKKLGRKTGMGFYTYESFCGRDG